MADEEEFFPSSLCNCSQKSAAHVHCPCSNCKGKAVHRITQLNHIRLQKEIKKLSAPECDDSHEHEKRAKDLDEDVEMNCEVEGRHFPESSLKSDEMETRNADEDEYRSSRLPLDISEMKFWKAEEFQKLAFPTSEFVLEGLLSPSDAEVWAPLPRIAEFVFNCGLNGWTTEMIENFTRLCWRYCVLVEEAYGEMECVITLHSLTHVLQDIMRFGSPDNSWCFQYERAVGRYVKQTSYKKGVEKTFARKESQREFIKVWSEKNKIKKQKQTGKFDQRKMVASSQQAAKNLVKCCKFGRNATRANNGVLIGKGDTHVITREEARSINTCLWNNFEIRETSDMATRYKSAFLPMHNVSCGGTVYKTGNEVSVLQGHDELIVN